MGQMAPLPCGLPLVWVRLSETTLTENLECSPIGSKVLYSTLLAAAAVNLVPDILVLPFLWFTPARLRGGFCHLGNSVSP